tara:strand:- start:1141 stop:1563 length:423 start_codon:yes stop_codon:yes gene_type:complete
MKIITFAVIVVLFASFVPIKKSNNSLLEAMCEVESGCNSNAIGDNGNAIGAYQIWYAYWYDAVTFKDNDELRLLDGYESCYDKDYSEKVILAYWERYATLKRLGRNPTDEDRARIHNGGPNGYKKDSTLKYWRKIQNARR